jgi:hypothetical protein
MRVVIFSMDSPPHPYGMARSIPATKNEFIYLTHCCFAKCFDVCTVDTST